MVITLNPSSIENIKRLQSSKIDFKKQNFELNKMSKHKLQKRSIRVISEKEKFKLTKWVSLHQWSGPPLQTSIPKTIYITICIRSKITVMK